MTAFAHDFDDDVSTLSELRRMADSLSPSEFLGCYAYARQSGFRAFDLAFGTDFWNDTSSRWLFGIDYGRTDPRALRAISDQANTEVRIFDGNWVLEQEGFQPRRDFHAKIAFMKGQEGTAIVLGSGNFSYNGLRRSIEAGASLFSVTSADPPVLGNAKQRFEELWTVSTPLEDILEQYEFRLAASKSEKDSKVPKGKAKVTNRFWIEAGYVTKNRGNDKPGNQIFFPKGFHTFFGLKGKKNPKKNSIIGSVTFRTPVGDDVTNVLRFNRNGMEKISLPMPETHGFGVYDGKVLVFERSSKGVLMNALEAQEFENLFGSKIHNVMQMTGGRRYGAIS
ncbi:hypothetical protein [Erythrobacter sp. F6033]|uniref:hypothetical protein n=1 Tax=Erythrobacter sp. F6033 TaxID=2926401 RepID=UPI001FF12470|nr:hypothetical protein [Erythrobacter sp. F6033]MCK0129233.1 hypothetical protein [Erythrobacter sp. F6033]